MERTIHSPEREHMTAAEVARWLGVSETTLKGLIRDGSFPPGVVFGRRAVRWPWMDAVAYAWLKARLRPPAPRGRR